MRLFPVTHWRYAVFVLCVAISVATGCVALAALARQPFLEDETAASLTLEELRAITAIEDVAIAPDFFDALPGGRRTDAQWWQLQQRVDRVLSAERRVVVQIAAESSVRSMEVAVVRPGLGRIANEVLIIYFCGFAYVVGALFVFMRHSTLASFLLALDFLSTAVSLFCAGATNLRLLSLPYESYRLLAALSATGALGFLVSTHFFLCFPAPKALLARVPKGAVALAYGMLLLQCLLIYVGVLPSVSTFAVCVALNLALTAAVVHSFASERDGFIKLQLGLLLGVIVCGFAILYGYYAFAPLLGVEPLEPAHIALMFLVGLFAFAAVFENVTLHKQRLAAEDRAQTEQEHLRREFHDNMLSRLANIALLSDAALQTGRDSAVLDRIAAIKREASSYSRYARGLLWISDDRCSWDEFLSHLRQHGHEAVADHDLEFELIVKPAAAARAAPLPVKHCLYKIFIEALTNTVKHAHARKIRMTIDANEASVQCRYEDDGRGFDPGVMNPGHYGLQHMRRQAQAVGGTLAVDAAVGAGTSIHLSIPL
jgi:signal transduction histidine kinase